MTDLGRADPDLTKGHLLLQQRAPIWERAAADAGYAVQRIEVYRSDDRQRWLYAQGRTAADCRSRGVNPLWARPGPIVTHAWSAKTSAHGFTNPDGTPAACAGDYAVLGPDGKPWTADDPWVEFMRWCLANEQFYGLRHFGPPLHPVTDQPHLQLVEYNDTTGRLDRVG